ncbi:cysteine desulfurase [Candidatus Nomurabacteria bacterium]|nr:cysteine desulfurase [Candidatus Nomurabacteria bacterium]
MQSRKKITKKSKIITRRYFDYAAATPVDPLVQKKMQTYDAWLFHNAGTIYKEGVLAEQALEDARARMATMLHAMPEEVIFTSGGTESDNLALYGILRAYQGKKKPHMIFSAIEHSAVYEWAVRMVERKEIEVTYLPVDTEGQVDLKILKESIRPETVLISIQYVNSETGTIQPVKDISRIMRKYRKEHESVYPYFHTDAAQAPLYIPIHLDTLGVDLLSLNGSKIYGPHLGSLVVRRGVLFEPLFYGGTQEHGRRAGTVHVSAVLGFVEALSLADSRREKDALRLGKQRASLVDKLAQFRHVHLLGNSDTTTPAHVFISVDQYPSELLVLELDARGIAVSSQSACTVGGGEISRVHTAVMQGADHTAGTIRITIGRMTTSSDIQALIQALKDIFKKYTEWYGNTK